MRKLFVVLPWALWLSSAAGHGQSSHTPQPGYWKLVEKHIVDDKLKPIVPSKDGKTPLPADYGNESDFLIDADGGFAFTDGIPKAYKIEGDKFLVFPHPGAPRPEITLVIHEQAPNRLALSTLINDTRHFFVYQRQ